MKRILFGMVTALVLCLSLCPVWALAANHEFKEALDFSKDSTPVGNLETDGYHWDKSSRTLTLQDIDIENTVTLPGTDPVTVITKEKSSIKQLCIENNGSSLKMDLTFSVTDSVTESAQGELTIAETINNGTDGDTLTVAQGAKVHVLKDINIGPSAGINCAVKVYGELTAAGGENGTALVCGKVLIGEKGTLNVSGNRGVAVNGDNGSYENAFCIKTGGTFYADCEEYNLVVNGGAGSGTFEGYSVEEAIKIPEGYLPLDYKVTTDTDKQTVTLAEKNKTVEWITLPDDPDNVQLKGAVSGKFLLHENHDWGDWEKSGTHHWKKCNFTGCLQKKDYEEHKYSNDSDTTCNVCPYERTVERPPHDWATDWSYDGTHHWHRCKSEGCGEKKDFGTHVYDNEQDAVCNVCPYQRTVVKPPAPAEPAPPSGGSSGGGGRVVTYPILIEESEYGKVTSDRARASEDSTVVLTVVPDSGYELETLTASGSRGDKLKLTAKNGGKYTFTMPDSAVTVTAAFAPVPEEEKASCGGGPDCPSRDFTDVGGVDVWYHEAVDFVLRNGLMSGYSNGTFVPEGVLSRAMLAQILYNKAGSPPVEGESPFADVLPGQWYTEAVIWAGRNGIVSGYGSGRFGPGDPVTREQLAVMLWRYAGSPAAAGKELRFLDAGEAGGYALDALCWAAEHGVVNGYEDGRLNPKGLVTRAQAAQMLMNLFR